MENIVLEKELIERLSKSSMLNNDIEKYRYILANLEKYGYIKVHCYTNNSLISINTGKEFEKAKDKYLE